MKTYGKIITFKISGMTCSGCAASVEEALRKVAGVTEVQVNLPEGKATVNVIPGDIDPEKLVAAVRMAGFNARPMD